MLPLLPLLLLSCRVCRPRRSRPREERILGCEPGVLGRDAGEAAVGVGGLREGAVAVVGVEGGVAGITGEAGMGVVGVG